MDILEKIVDHKKREVAEAKKKKPIETLQTLAEQRTDHRPFETALTSGKGGPVRIIAEIKRASPSKGSICPDLDPAAYARAYEKGGAAALSVLTDHRFFSGGADDLVKARSAVRLPVLRKDFVISPYQIYESAALGADAILLIVRILSPESLGRYLETSRRLGMDALVETHSAEEIEVACRAGARIIGINNRDLKTFDTSIETTLNLSADLNNDRIAVAESGIRSPSDIKTLHRAGISNFLIGESLVRSGNPTRFIRELAEELPGQSAPRRDEVGQ